MVWQLSAAASVGQVRVWSLLPADASQSGMSHAPTPHPVLAFIGVVVVAVRSPLQGDVGSFLPKEGN